MKNNLSFECVQEESTDNIDSESEYYCSEISSLRHRSAKEDQLPFVMKELYIRRTYHFFSFVKLVYSLIQARKQAAIFIQKHVRGYLTYKDMKSVLKSDKSKLIKWHGSARTVSFKGSFSNPQWGVSVDLQYSRSLKIFYSLHFAETRIPSGKYSIKFIVDGEWACSQDLPVEYDKNQNKNNIVKFKNPRTTRASASGDLNIDEFKSSLLGETEYPVLLAKSISQTPYYSDDRELRIVCSGKMIAKPRNKNEFTALGSSDAYFINECSQILGIADGVGGWANYGINPSRFSKELMKNCDQMFKEVSEQSSTLNPHDLLEQTMLEAHKNTKSFGSSTILLAMCKGNYLYTLNLGDSGLIVLRRKKNSWAVVFKCKEQQHYFNTPYQLSKIPNPQECQDLIQKGKSRFVEFLNNCKKPFYDTAFDAESEMVPLNENDIVIAGTDGIFDNLFVREIVSITESCYNERISTRNFTEKLAKRLTERSIERGWEPTYKSPFSKHAYRAGKKFMGGKLDDSTVVVGCAKYYKL